jgi:hypothetical protein
LGIILAGLHFLKMQNSEVYIVTTSVFLIHNENAFKKIDYITLLNFLIFLLPIHLAGNDMIGKDL